MFDCVYCSHSDSQLYKGEKKKIVIKQPVTEEKSNSVQTIR